MRLISCLVLLMLIGSGAFASSQGDAAEAVRKLERAWLDAYEQRDEKAMNAIVADDFTITFPNGSMQSKTQILGSLKRTRPAGRSIRFHTEDVQARVYGDTVILIGRVVTQYQQDGQTVSKEERRYTDTYVKRDGRWQVVSSHLSNAMAARQP